MGELKVFDKKEYNKNWKKNNRQKVNKAAIARRLKDPLKFMLASIKSRSKKLGIDFDLTLDWIKEHSVGKKCPMTGAPFVMDFSNSDPYKPSVDKIDPTKGYTQDNCRVVSWIYNRTKGTWTDMDVYSFALQVVKLNESKRVYAEEPNRSC